MVCVVMIHSHSIGTYESPASWCVFLQMLLMRTTTNWAVPFFFAVSGFFFAERNLQMSTIGYVKLLQKKVRSLLVPYILWALIGTAISMSLTVLNNYLLHRGLFERTFMASIGLWGKADALFGITSNGPSGNLALWYVHTLILLFVVSPLFIMLSRMHDKLLFIGGLVLAVGFPNTSISALSLKLGSIGWFWVGMGASQLKLEDRKIPVWVVVLCGICWLGLAICGAMEKAGYMESSIVGNWLGALAALAGVLFWWGIYDLWSINKSCELPVCYKMTFWVYCLHGVVTGWFLASVSYLLGKTELVAMLASCVSVIGSLVFCLASGRFMKHRFPKLYLVLSGGR